MTRSTSRMSGEGVCWVMRGIQCLHGWPLLSCCLWLRIYLCNMHAIRHKLGPRGWSRLLAQCMARWRIHLEHVACTHRNRTGMVIMADLVYNNTVTHVSGGAAHSAAVTAETLIVALMGTGMQWPAMPEQHGQGFHLLSLGLCIS
jgi:hypothetical protein